MSPPSLPHGGADAFKLVRAVVREPPGQTPLSGLPDAIRPFDPLHLDACRPRCRGLLPTRQSTNPARNLAAGSRLGSCPAPRLSSACTNYYTASRGRRPIVFANVTFGTDIQPYRRRPGHCDPLIARPSPTTARLIPSMIPAPPPRRPGPPRRSFPVQIVQVAPPPAPSHWPRQSLHPAGRPGRHNFLPGPLGNNYIYETM